MPFYSDHAHQTLTNQDSKQAPQSQQSRSAIYYIEVTLGCRLARSHHQLAHKTKPSLLLLRRPQARKRGGKAARQQPNSTSPSASSAATAGTTAADHTARTQSTRRVLTRTYRGAGIAPSSSLLHERGDMTRARTDETR
ncbi:hypothetical protein CIB48_g7472 [Xylaria polymorpha]|nr:hypothetical protein CIB48_g7472 [Xylaria polymorpha]